MKGAVILIIILVSIAAIGLMLATHLMQEMVEIADKDVYKKLFHWTNVALYFCMIALGVVLLTLPRLITAL